MTSKHVVLLVVIILGLFLLLSLGGVVYLVDSGQPADRIALIGTPMGVALGALAAILVSTRSTVTNGEKAPPAEVSAPPAVVPPSDDNTQTDYTSAPK